MQLYYENKLKQKIKVGEIDFETSTEGESS